MLKDPGLHEKVTGGAKCKSYWDVKGKTWFTSRHHRKTTHRIEQGEADTGVVWTTEVAYAKRKGRPIDGVAVPVAFNKQDRLAMLLNLYQKTQDEKCHTFSWIFSDKRCARY